MSNIPEATLLGKNVEVPQTYDPSVLVKVPRATNRDQYRIDDYLFDGYDNWNCFECSSLTSTGVPFYFRMGLRYPSNSQYIVESKSLKLYLNSFNMTRIGSRVEMIETVTADLIKLLQTDVKYYNIDYCEKPPKEIKSLNDACDLNLIEIRDDEYQHQVKFLKTYNIMTSSASWRFDGFRSNCKVTHAPDFATIFIDIGSTTMPIPESLIRYLTSFRNEAHLHEECCELIFRDLTEVCKPKFLKVACNYTRRGGIDIVPTRWSKDYPFTTPLIWRTEYQ